LIIDFGTIRKFIDSTGAFNLKNETYGYIGSLKFSSINCHSMRATSLRDDLESLGYTILSLLLSDKEKFWFDSESSDHKYFIAEKKKFI